MIKYEKTLKAFRVNFFLFHFTLQVHNHEVSARRYMEIFLTMILYRNTYYLAYSFAQKIKGAEAKYTVGAK